MYRQARLARHRGFALVLVLMLVAMVGVLSAGSLQEALFGEVLASTRLFHQRATLMADAGVANATRRLGTLAPSPDFVRELRPLPGSAESVVVSLRHVARAGVVAGFSIGRFEQHSYVIESTGRGPGGTTARQVQGIDRVLPAEPPVVAP
jgi:hypothetical protein